MWVDILGDNDAEAIAIEKIFKIDIITKSEMEGIEESARFYEEDGNLYFNIFVPARAGAVPYEKVPNDTFYQRSNLGIILTNQTLITYHEFALKSLETGKTRASVRLANGNTTAQALTYIIEALIERQAGLLARIGNDLDDVTLPLLAEERLEKAEPRLKKLGQLGAQIALCRDCLFDLGRMVAFLHNYEQEFGFNRKYLNALKADVTDLSNLIQSQTSDLAFVLDATLGMINARQSNAMTIMAIVTLIFAPPTLLASIFGMNFAHWTAFNVINGQYFAFALMALSALFVLIFAKLSKLF